MMNYLFLSHNRLFHLSLHHISPMAHCRRYRLNLQLLYFLINITASSLELMFFFLFFFLTIPEWQNVSYIIIMKQVAFHFECSTCQMTINFLTACVSYAIVDSGIISCSGWDNVLALWEPTGFAECFTQN
jgi:hypothetical protein